MNQSTTVNIDAAMSVETVRVDLAERSYDIHVGEGLIESAGKIVSPLLRIPETIVVTEENVAEHWLQPLMASLEGAGISAESIVLKPGEETKKFDNLTYLIERFLSSQVERHSTVIALGGGVIGDLVGFAAAVTLRGIDFIQIPTTLLAQVDSSVGGKTAINTRHGKNLVGAFHQPKLVLADTRTLGTLPPRELRAGYAEVVKYGLIRDASFFEWLEINGRRIIDGDQQARRHAILHSCRTKADVVGADERESGVRALLNFGHTFGHALEAENAFGPALLHGEAVGIGSVLALMLSERSAVCPPGQAGRLRKHLSAMDMMTDIAHIDGATTWSAENLLAHMAHDKKVLAGKLNFILAREIGDAYVSSDVDHEIVLSVLSDSLSIQTQ